MFICIFLLLGMVGHDGSVYYGFIVTTCFQFTHTGFGSLKEMGVKGCGAGGSKRRRCRKQEILKCTLLTNKQPQQNRTRQN